MYMFYSINLILYQGQDLIVYQETLLLFSFNHANLNYLNSYVQKFIWKSFFLPMQLKQKY